MSENGYLKVAKWDKFQQYKDGRPMLFIRVDTGLLDDYRFDLLPEISQAHLLKIWLLAGKNNNKIINDPKWIARKIGASGKVDIDQLVQDGWLESYESVRDSTNPALEKRREEKRREEKREPHKKRASQPPADWKLPDDYREYCTTKRPDLDPDATAENFRDYHLGHGKPMSDWKATWRNWVRKEYGTRKQKSDRTGKPAVSPATRNREATADYFRGRAEGGCDLVAEND